MADELPMQIDKRIRRALTALDRPWRLVKKRDHYFVQIEDKPMICVADNSSKNKHSRVKWALERISKA